jgi:putative transposase
VATPRTELDLHRGRSAVYTLHVQMVFVTKYRRPAFTAEMLTSCERLMIDTGAGRGTQLREFTGETDHMSIIKQYIEQQNRPD